MLTYRRHKKAPGRNRGLFLFEQGDKLLGLCAGPIYIGLLPCPDTSDPFVVKHAPQVEQGMGPPFPVAHSRHSDFHGRHPAATSLGSAAGSVFRSGSAGSGRCCCRSRLRRSWARRLVDPCFLGIYPLSGRHARSLSNTGSSVGGKSGSRAVILSATRATCSTGVGPLSGKTVTG